MSIENFTYDYLEAAFWSKVGKGGATIEVDGVLVTKSLHQHSSNSGKSKDWEVIFTFKDSNGAACEVRKDSRFGPNRRNDAKRNWGLHE